MQTHLNELQIKDKTADRTWTIEKIPVLTAVSSLPHPVDLHSRVQRRISHYYQAQEHAFFHYCQHTLFPLAAREYHTALQSSAPLPCFHAKLTYQVTWNQGGLFSLYTESTEHFGSSLLRIRHGDTWDLNTGFPVPISSLFPPKTPWRNVLFATAAETIKQQEQCCVAQYYPHWEKLLRRYFNSRNYFLTAAGVTFFYPMYTIAPSVEGIPAFTVPHDVLSFRHPALLRKKEVSA